MKQVTTKKIKELEHAFYQGKKIMYYAKGYDFTSYEVTDIKKIKELVICDYCVRVYKDINFNQYLDIYEKNVNYVRFVKEG